MTDQPTNPNALDTMIDNEFESGKKRGPGEDVSLCNREWMEILTEYRAMRVRIARLEKRNAQLLDTIRRVEAVLDEKEPTDDKQG